MVRPLKTVLTHKIFCLYKGLSDHTETDIALSVSCRKVSPELCFYLVLWSDHFTARHFD